MKYIPLTKGLMTCVDDSDYVTLSQYKWYVVGHPGKEYAARCGRDSTGKQIHIRMHREILSAPTNMEVDHIDGNRLNNCRSNLRLATRSQNGSNRTKSYPNATSKYKGVTWHKRDQYWQATIIHQNRHIHLGCFSSEKEAAVAYNTAAKKYHGNFAKLNNITEE